MLYKALSQMILWYAAEYIQQTKIDTDFKPSCLIII